MNELAGRAARRSTPGRVESRIGRIDLTEGARRGSRWSVGRPPRIVDVSMWPDRLPRRVDAGDASGVPRDRCAGQPGADLLGADRSSSWFPTANADTVRDHLLHRSSDGPMVVETPPDALGVFDDTWFHWIIDFGLPGLDRCGRQVAGRPARLPRPARERPRRRPLPHPSGPPARPVVHPARRSGADGGDSRTGPRSTRTSRGWGGDRVPTSSKALVRPRRRQRCRRRPFVEDTGLAFNTIPPTDARFPDRTPPLQDEPADAGIPRSRRPLELHRQGRAVRGRRPDAQDPRGRRSVGNVTLAGAAVRRPR